MGQPECKPQCTATTDGKSEAYGDEIQSITDDPYVLASVVRQSWGKIPREQPPAQEGQMPIPVTFQMMFTFNVAVMNKPGGPDMTFIDELLPFDVFSQLVANVDDPGMLKKHCEDLVPKISAKGATIEGLDLFKNVMLASNRSLAPRDWTSQHELAWSWFWERIAKYLQLPTGSLVKTSWGKIPKEPVKLEGVAPEELLAQVPTTFKDMANFNNMVMAKSGGYADFNNMDTSKIQEGRPDMTWAADLMYPAMEALVGVCDNEEGLQKECDTLGETFKEKGITREQVNEFKPLLLASLRSLLPVDWDNKTEAAWSTFFDTVGAKVNAKL